MCIFAVSPSDCLLNKICFCNAILSYHSLFYYLRYSYTSCNDDGQLECLQYAVFHCLRWFTLENGSSFRLAISWSHLYLVLPLPPQSTTKFNFRKKLRLFFTNLATWHDKIAQKSTHRSSFDVRMYLDFTALRLSPALRLTQCSSGLMRKSRYTLSSEERRYLGLLSYSDVWFPSQLL